MSHASYIYSNIRNLQFLEPHVFIFYWHHHDPIRVIPAGLDWLCPGFHGFIGGLQQDTLEVTYDSKHCWAMAPTRARGVLIDLWMTPLVTPLVMCFGKKKVDGTWHKMLTKRSGGWVLSEVHPHPGAAAWSLRGLWWWARPANQKPSSGRLGGLQGENEVRKTEKISWL